MDIVVVLIPFIFIFVAVGLVAGAVYGSVRMARGCEGGWRTAALLPVIVLGLAVANIAVGVALDPTSHNLWPFEILMVSATGLVWLGLLRLLRAGAAGTGAAAAAGAAPGPTGTAAVAAPASAPRPAGRPPLAPARTETGLQAILSHPVARIATGALAVYAVVYGYGALRAGEGRGAAALIVIGAGGLFWAATGRVPTWLFRR